MIGEIVVIAVFLAILVVTLWTILGVDAFRRPRRRPQP